VQTACWVLFDDTLQLTSTNVLLVQRYVMALFYFGSGSDRIDSRTHTRDSFLASDTECDWYSNRCNEDGHITLISAGKSPTLVRGFHACLSPVVF
jgi:hypothetical protein